MLTIHSDHAEVPITTSLQPFPPSNLSPWAGSSPHKRLCLSSANPPTLMFQPSYSITLGSSSLTAGARKKYSPAVTNLIAPLAQSTLMRPPLLLSIHPLMILPASNNTTAPTLRSLLTLFVARSLKSPMISQYVLVITFTGSSLKPKRREVAIWIPD